MNPERGKTPEIQAQRTIFSIRLGSPEIDIENIKSILLPWVESQENPNWLIHDFEISETNFINFTIDSNSPLEITVFDSLKEYLNSVGYSLFSALIIPASLNH